MFNRGLAPISDETWKEIEDRLMEVFKSHLSARKVVKVVGPKGLDYNVISEGRLEEIHEEGELFYANYKVTPLTEVRVEFELDKWELDNVLRGAKDVDYEPLEEAAKKIALFEESVIYNGSDKLNIKGLVKSSAHEMLEFGNDQESILDSIANGIIKLRESYQEGPFVLVVGKEAFRRIVSKGEGYSLRDKIESLTGHKIVYSHVLDGAVLVPYDHEDLELTIGQDLDIGYQSYDNNKIRFFITESFTFRVLDPTIIVSYKL